MSEACRAPANPPAGGEVGGTFFASPGTNFLRYTSVAVQILLRTGCESRYKKFNRKQGSVQLGQVLQSCLSSKKSMQKNVTDLLILLSVLQINISFSISHVLE